MNDESAFLSFLIRIGVAYLCFDLFWDALAHYRHSPTARGLRWVVLTTMVLASGVTLLVGALFRLGWLPEWAATGVGWSVAGMFLVGLIYLWIARRWGAR